MADDQDALLLQVSADVRALEKQMSRAVAIVDGAGKQMEKEAHAVAKMVGAELSNPTLNRNQVMELTHVAKSLFDQMSAGASPMRALQVEGGRIAQIFAEGEGGVGGTFRALGALLTPMAFGFIGAGAAAVTFAVAMAKAKAAAEYADELEKTANKLGVTTEALQGYDFVALKAGISTQTFRSAIEHGTTAFGAFLSNVGDTRVKQAFAAIGITKEQARSFGDLATALPTIADRIKGIGNAAEQAQIAKKLGLEEMLPILRRGGDALRDDIKEARELGLVINDSMIKQGAKAAEQLRVASEVVQGNLTRAFIALAPLVGAVTDKVATLAMYIADAAESFRSLENQSQGYLQREAKREQTGVDTDAKVAEFFGARKQADGTYKGGLLSTPGGLVDSINAREAHIHAMNKQSAGDQLDEEMRAAALKGNAHPLAPEKDKKPKKGPADRTDDFDKTAADAADQAAKELASAQAALTKNIEAHAEAEKRAVDDETEKKLTDLAKQEADIRKSKNDAHSKQQRALLEAAKADTKSAAAAKKEAIDREAAAARSKADLEFQQTLDKYDDDVLSARAAMSTSARARADLELQIFRDEQARAMQSRKLENAAKVKNGEMTQPESDADLAGMKADQSSALVAKRYSEERASNPLFDYGQQLQGNVDNAGQKLEVQGLEAMNDGLVKGLQNWKDMGAAAKGVLQEITSDLLRMAVERSITMPLAGALWGSQNTFGNIAQTTGTASVGSWLGGLFGGAHAAGGTIPAGKVGLVGEKGPELAIGGSSGTNIVPNNVLNAIGGLSPAGSNVRNNNSVTIEEHYHLDGAVSERDVMGMISRGRDDTLNKAAAMFKNGFGPQLASFSALQN